MVERDRGLGKSEPLNLEDVAGMFGVNYRKLVEDRAKQVGIREKLQFFDAPRPHNGSQALYLAEELIGDNLVLVSVLQPHMQTSRHHHEPPMTTEKYFHILGESFANIGGYTFALNHRQDSIEVPLGTIHQVTTGENPALTLIIMERARLVTPGKLHIKDT